MMAALAAMAAACAPKQDPAASATASGAPPAVGAACTGEKLPITGVCADAQPALFGYLDAQEAPYAATCKWVTAEAQRSDTEAVVFRIQQCPADVAPATSYRFDGDKLLVKYPHPEPGREPYENLIAEFYAIPDGQTAEAIALTHIADAPADERPRCVVTPAPDVRGVAGQAFHIAPNEELMAELNRKHPDEPFEACGAHGYTNDGIVYWEKRPDLLIWHVIGQEQPIWDPASFTIYKRDASGAWTKQ
jgi:hypothetical protein